MTLQLKKLSIQVFYVIRPRYDDCAEVGRIENTDSLYVSGGGGDEE